MEYDIIDPTAIITERHYSLSVVSFYHQRLNEIEGDYGLPYHQDLNDDGSVSHQLLIVTIRLIRREITVTKKVGLAGDQHSRDFTQQ